MTAISTAPNSESCRLPVTPNAGTSEIRTVQAI